jgi:hypothetical protein
MGRARLRWLRRPSRRTLVRLDALGDAGLAAFLLAASWDGLYRWLGLAPPEPPFYAQLLGVTLGVIALAEWLLAGRPGERQLSLAVGAGNALAAAVLAAALAAGRAAEDSHGEILLWSIVGSLVLEAWLHWRVARR